MLLETENPRQRFLAETETTRQQMQVGSHNLIQKKRIAAGVRREQNQRLWREKKVNSRNRKKLRKNF